MIKRIFVILQLFFFLFLIDPAYAKEVSQKSLDTYINKISDKFSRTYCNSTKFGISEDGALAFAIGETNKEFKNKKLNNLIDFSALKNNIIINLENKCQVYDFPESILKELQFE